MVFSYFTDATALNNALLTGAVDIITSVQSPDALAQFKDNPGFTVTEGQSTTKELLAFNQRQALHQRQGAQGRPRHRRREAAESVWGEYGKLIGSFVRRPTPGTST